VGVLVGIFFTYRQEERCNGMLYGVLVVGTRSAVLRFGGAPAVTASSGCRRSSDCRADRSTRLVGRSNVGHPVRVLRVVARSSSALLARAGQTQPTLTVSDTPASPSTRSSHDAIIGSTDGCHRCRQSASRRTAAHGGQQSAASRRRIGEFRNDSSQLLRTLQSYPDALPGTGGANVGARRRPLDADLPSNRRLVAQRQRGSVMARRVIETNVLAQNGLARQ
jgi:hypothetical protein